MANPLSGLTGFSVDVNDFSLRLEGDTVEADTDDDMNNLGFRLDGETVKFATIENSDLSFRSEGEVAVTTNEEVAEAATNNDVNDLSLRVGGGEIVETSTNNDMNDLSFRLEREIVVTATVDHASDLSFRLEGETVETATNRMFKICDTYILSALKEIIRIFSLKWNFASSIWVIYFL